MVRDLKIVLLLLLSIIIISSGVVFADEMQDLTCGIEAYKSGNYTECITKMKSVVQDDPTSAVAYYYLGLAYTKIDEKISAVQNYNKVINLGSDATLVALAKKGKQSIGGEKKVEKIEKQIEEIEEVEEEYNPIFNDTVVDSGKQSKPQNQSETKTEPKTTKVIKASDYAQKDKAQSGAKFEFDPNREPTNDEIVNAIKILQKAGLLQNGASAITGGNQQMSGYQKMPQQAMPQMDSRTQQMYSMMQMMNNGNNNNGMMNMMPYMNGGKVDPQVMQMMLMQQMMPNFGGGNNNNNGY